MKQCNLDLAMVFRRLWRSLLLGYSGCPTSISDFAHEYVPLDSHNEHANDFVLDACPNLSIHDMHKSVHPSCAQPHVKLVSI